MPTQFVTNISSVYVCTDDMVPGGVKAFCRSGSSSGACMDYEAVGGRTILRTRQVECHVTH